MDYLSNEVISGINLYSYCGNDPVNYYDPSGHITLTAILISFSLVDWLLIGTSIVLISSSIALYKNKGFEHISFDLLSGLKNIINDFKDNVSIFWNESKRQEDVDNIDYERFCFQLTSIWFMMKIEKEHRTTHNGKGRTRIIHEKGQSRKKLDKFGGEKGDIRRKFRRHKKSHLWWILHILREDDEDEEDEE